jgi:hypothetical protein
VHRRTEAELQPLMPEMVADRVERLPAGGQ